MLPAEQIEEIKREAEKAIPVEREGFGLSKMDVVIDVHNYKREGYVAGATAERIKHLEYQQKVGELVEALKKIRDWKDEWDSDDPGYIARHALSSLTNKIKL